jgi:hypothetical protein
MQYDRSQSVSNLIVEALTGLIHFTLGAVADVIEPLMRGKDSYRKERRSVFLGERNWTEVKDLTGRVVVLPLGSLALRPSTVATVDRER